MDKINIKRGSFLRYLRETSHYSERDLAELMGVEPSDITVWETGIKFPEDPFTIDKLAKILNVTKKELLNGEFNKNKKDVDKYTELDYEEAEESSEAPMSMRKTVALVILSCAVLFVFIFAIATITKPSDGLSDYDPNYVVSDKRETVIHTPRKVNENVVHNTTALVGTKEEQDTSKSKTKGTKYTYNYDLLLDYGFVYKDGKYIKYGYNYRFEIYDGIIHMYCDKIFIYKYMEEDVDQTFVKYYKNADAPLTKIENNTFGTYNCDTRVCEYSLQYLRYVNLLMKAIRGN